MALVSENLVMIRAMERGIRWGYGEENNECKGVKRGWKQEKMLKLKRVEGRGGRGTVKQLHYQTLIFEMRV